MRPDQEREPFPMQKIKQRLDQLEFKLQIMVTTIRELQTEVRSLSEANQAVPVAPESQSHAVSHIEIHKPKESA
jgi:FtsZ-binding cell division protein ZapB